MAKVNKFGTFGGVFTPSILTILGVIMYMRLPMIVGEAGLWATLSIIAIAHIISVTTGLSVSSIATDKKVAAGGTYYMISRSLGLPIGGTLGLALFVGLSFSVSLYLIGFAESFLSYWGFEVSINYIRIAGTIILILVTTITLVSTSLAIKTQYIIMAAIVLSLISILAGRHDLGPKEVAESLAPVATGVPFMVLFGIFFPAVTGFEAGVSMSGDLADPKRSIPKGSIMAILVGLVVYIALAAFFALTVDPEILSNDPQVLLKISWNPQLVAAGIWGATLSSALGSILGAPRILQATAADNITPRIFSRGVGASNEPRNALLLTFLIAEAGILIGDLDIIARVVSIFFITTYAFLNLSCAFEAWTSADFRPSFKTPVWVSLLGAAACFIVMIELDFVATLGASFILGGLYFYLKRRELVLQSGDTWAGVWSSLAKTSLQRLTVSRGHHRNWRPNILMFNGADKARPFMLQLGNAISGKLGLLSSFELILSDKRSKPQLIREPEENNEKIFRNTYACHDNYTGIDEIARVHGYSGIQPNTVLMGWSTKPENKDKFIGLMHNLQQYNLNSLFLFHHATANKLSTPSIDVWWSGRGRNLSLALSLLRHLTSSDPWNRAIIRVFIVINEEEDTEHISRYVKNLLSDYRVNVTLRIIDNHFARQPADEIISAESALTDLSIIGISDGSYDDLRGAYQFATGLCDQLRSVLFINASSTFEEHNVVKQQSTPTSPGQKNEWILPDVPEPRYAEITEDIGKIDVHGLQLIEALLKKIFIPSFKPEMIIYEKLQSLADTTCQVLDKVLKFDQPYQRNSAIMRAKKHFNKQIISLLDHSLENSVGVQGEVLEEGMKWYIEQLETSSDRFPKRLTIAYDKKEFVPQKDDRANLRWYKFRKSILHPFSRKSISLNIHYREGATYFLRDLRFYFLTTLLQDLEKNQAASREQFRHFISSTDGSFQLLLSTSDLDRQNEILREFMDDLKRKTGAMLTHSHELQSVYKGRLQLEHRKNVIFFMHQLERIDFNSLIRRKRRHKKLYANRKIYLYGFASGWSEKATLDLNTIKSSALLYDYFGQVEREIQGFIGRLKQFFDKEQIQSVNNLLIALKEVSQSPVRSKPPTLPEREFNGEFALEKLRAATIQLISRTSILPEESIVAVEFDGKEEALTLPLRAMASHLTEAALTGPITDTLEDLLASIGRSNLIINDLASLAVFNVFNAEEPDEESVREDEIDKAVASIEQEMVQLTAVFNSAIKDIERQCDDLQRALKIHHLTDLSGDFSTLVRNQRKRRLQGRVSAQISHGVDILRRTLVSALYSRAKGILLARQLSTATLSLSVNERIMNAVRSVMPLPGILLRLPHYYVSLFSGRSNIGDNFWVARPAEERQFDSAFQRYLVNRQGMLLVLGERNSGKTALCKHFVETVSTDHTVYHLFPTEDGSVSIAAFETALQKVTRIEGDTAQIFSLLPHNTILVIHDVELWWERSAEHGLTVIRFLKTLVEEFSSKCLMVLNMNPFAYAVVNMAEPLDTHCAGVVRCLPFNSFELKQLIMTRHKSSGLSLDVGAGVTERLGEIKTARIFNHLFAYSKGNPGVAMNGWLAGIQDFRDKVIVWQAPQTKDEDVLAEMPQAWGHLCLQLLLHKRMGLKKIMRTVQLERGQIINSLAVMKRLQLISVRGNSLYYLNPNIEFLLIDYFKEKEWI